MIVASYSLLLLGGVLLLDLNDVTNPDLRSVVHDILIVLKLELSLFLDVVLVVIDDRSVGNLDTIRQDNRVLVAWTTSTTTFDTVIWVLQLFNVLCLIQLL
jgi:hypothetical protein